VALITIALLLVGTLGTDAVSKALVSAGIGLMLSTVGADPITGEYRYVFNAVGLYSGISLVALFVGLFAIPQMVLVFGTGTTIARQDMMGNEVASSTAVVLEKGFGKQVLQGVGDTFTHWLAVLRAGIIGVVTGIVPGIGGFAANFMSYGIAQQFSKKRDQFGTGIPEGIIAPEGSSLAKEAGGMVPLLGLGIPGGVGGALFLAALTIRGVQPGFGFTTKYPTLAYETVWIIALGGLVGTLAGLLAAPQLAKVTRVPGPFLVPLIMSISVVGTFAADVTFFSVLEVAVFAIVGFALRRLRYSLAVFGIGLILGPQLEQSIYQTHEIFPGVSFLARPLADVLFAVGLGIIGLKGFQFHKDAKKNNAPIEEADPVRRAEKLRAREQKLRPYPLLAMIANVLVLGVTIPFLIYTASEYSFNTGLMPMIAGSVAAAAAVWRFPTEISHYIHHLADKHEEERLLEGAGLDPKAPAPPPELQPVSVGARTIAVDGGEGSLHSVGDITDAVGPVPVRLSVRGGRSQINDKSWGRHGQYTRELAAFGWFASLLTLSYLFSFEVGLGTFCALYALFGTRYVMPSLVKRAIFGAVSAAVMVVAAYEILNLLHISLSPVFPL